MTDEMGRFRSTYLSVDVRTLGLARLFIGSLLLLDLAKRSPEAEYWYAETGLLPTRVLGEAPISAWDHGFMVWFGATPEVHIAFGAVATVYALFLIGFKTRLFHVLSFVCLASIQLRVDLLSNGGDMVLCNLVLWTAFLPMGAAFSVDARRRRRAGNEIASPVVHPAVLAVLLQLATIYYFSAVHKNGANWFDGTAVYFLTKQERMVTWFGLWLRESAPVFVFQALTYSALAIEFMLPALILSPWGHPYTRRISIALIWGLHCGIAAVANVGVFSAVMLSYSTLLVSTDDWEWLRAKAAARLGDGHWLTRGLSLPSPDVVVDDVEVPPLRRAVRAAAGLFLAVLMFTATTQVLFENRAVPKWLKPSPPQWVHTTVRMLRLGQGWHMFSAEAPRTEQHLVVDATTIDGRRIDPVNLLASRVVDPELRQIPPRVTQNYYWGDYIARIDGRREHKLVLQDWVLRHYERTGREEDFIPRFKVFVITQVHAGPGKTEPVTVSAKRILYHR